jgi:hypothetical protein
MLLSGINLDDTGANGVEPEVGKFLRELRNNDEDDLLSLVRPRHLFVGLCFGYPSKVYAFACTPCARQIDLDGDDQMMEWVKNPMEAVKVALELTGVNIPK